MLGKTGHRNDILSGQIILLFKNGIIILLLIIGPLNCRKINKVSSNYVINNKPYFIDSQFLELNELYSIDMDRKGKYFISNPIWMDVDKDSNLYVLDRSEAKIFVFDKDGKYMRNIGGKGYGPRELIRPENFYIRDNLLYINEGQRGLKIWNIRGEYLNFINFKKELYFATYIPVVKGFIGLGFISQFSVNENKINYWRLSKYMDDLTERELFVSLKWDMEREFRFRIEYCFCLDSNRNAYIPIARDKYIINKYDVACNHVLTFGRDYSNRPFSDNVIKAYNLFYKNELDGKILPPLEEYPQTVRNIHVDEKDYIWVGVGECTFDSRMMANVENNIDIFDSNGKYLYNFKLNDNWGFDTIIKNSRVYTLPTINKNRISVYKVNYRF